MPEVTLQINGRGYGIFCDDGQEDRILELAEFIDSRLQDIAASGAASAESHLLVLTSLVLADELFEARENGGQSSSASVDEEQAAQFIEHLAGKIEHLAGRIHSKEAA